MNHFIEMVKHKFRRAFQLLNLRYARWLFMQWFQPNVILTSSLDNGLVIQYRPQGPVSQELYTGRLEHDVIDFFRYFLKPGMVVFDVGANIGIYSLLGAKLVGQYGSVHAFEPTPATFAQLVANVMLNGFNWIHLNQKAVSEESGTSLLYLYKQNPMNSLARQDWVGQPLGQIAIETVTLDEYVSEQALPRVDLIKIDVEGAEILVLKGARQLLNGSNPPAVICEFSDKTTHGFGYDAMELRQFLEDQGYKLYRWELRSRSLVPEPKRPNYTTIYANLIGVKGKN